jgi:hypothetical protein
MNQQDDTEGSGGRFPKAPDLEDDTEGSGGRFPEAPDLEDDTEGSGMRFPEAPDVDDDVAGHFRLTDEQLAAGLTPSEVTTKSAPRDPNGPPRD